MTPAEAAIEYAARGWPVFPVRPNRVPYTNHGQNDATNDQDQVRDWWQRWPQAVPCILTGEPSGVIALDIDVRPNGSGFDSLAELSQTFHPKAPTAHSPRGGCAVLFRWPGTFVATSTGKLGPYLDLKGDNGTMTLPPGPGRFWDPHLGPDLRIPEMPDWLRLAEPEPAAPRAAVQQQQLSKYAEAALDAAVQAIVDAPDGAQRDTINREVYGIGELVGGGVIGASIAYETLRWAVSRVRTFDSRSPWRQRDLDRITKDAFADGLAHPRQPENRL